MPVRRIGLHRVELPVEDPFVTSARRMDALERVLVEVRDDEGRVGWGEAAPQEWITGETARASAATLEDVLGPLVLGADPADVVGLEGTLAAEVAGAPAARAAVETALHDLRGRALGEPLHRLLGADPPDPAVAAPAVLSLEAPAEVEAAAEEAVVEGYGAVKVKVGGDPAVDVERIEAAAGAVPEGVRVTVDANGGWSDAKEALAAIRAVEDLVDAVEQPVPAGNVADLAYVRERSRVPVVADEDAGSAADVVDLERRGAVDAVNVKLQQAGGLLPALRAAHAAGAAGRPVRVGSMVASGVGTAASLHLALAAPAVEANDLVGPFLFEERVTTWDPSPPRLTAEGPGLGVSVDRKRLEAARVGERVVEADGAQAP